MQLLYVVTLCVYIQLQTFPGPVHIYSRSIQILGPKGKDVKSTGEVTGECKGEGKGKDEGKSEGKVESIIEDRVRVRVKVRVRVRSKG